MLRCIKPFAVGPPGIPIYCSSRGCRQQHEQVSGVHGGAGGGRPLQVVLSGLSEGQRAVLRSVPAEAVTTVRGLIIPDPHGEARPLRRP